MNQVQIASLVEGDGEVEALPILLRRVVGQISPLISPVIPRPFRHPSGSIQRVGGLERALNAVAKLYSAPAIVILIDCDDATNSVRPGNIFVTEQLSIPSTHIQDTIGRPFPCGSTMKK